MSPSKKESLPVGVGRLPEWWMELTPHHTLDLEDDEARRKAEEDLAIYFAQMLTAGEGGPDGQPLLDLDGKPIAGSTSGGGGWKSNWSGRKEKDSSGNDNNGDNALSSLFRGRNFQPGSSGWDPKQWGIRENNPDYQAYLKGSRLPPEYLAAMKKFALANGTDIESEAANRLSTDFERYGRNSDNPAFQPAWAKKKLRSTTLGTSARQGLYDDSPNKHLEVNKTLRSYEQQNYYDKMQSVASTADYAPPVSEQAPIQEEDGPIAAPYKQYEHSDYYYNAKSNGSRPDKASNRYHQPPESEDSDEHEAEGEQGKEYVGDAHDKTHEEGEEYEEYVEEYEEEEQEEEEEEEEEPEESEPVADETANLMDLQALLAAKQAELARLQGL